MSYVLGAYGLVLAALGLYALHLASARRTLRKSASDDGLRERR